MILARSLFQYREQQQITLMDGDTMRSSRVSGDQVGAPLTRQPVILIETKPHLGGLRAPATHDDHRILEQPRKLSESKSLYLHVLLAAMNNQQFRKLVFANSDKSPETKDGRSPPTTAASSGRSLGSRKQANIPMTP